jgi:hypothetical protein
MQVLDDYNSIDNMLTDLEQLIDENKLDVTNSHFSIFDKALKQFCADHLINDSELAHESAIKLNLRLLHLITKIEVAKKETAQTLREQVNGRKKISAYRNI